MNFRLLFAAAGFAFAAATLPAQSPDLLIADFEGTNYGTWKAVGEAFGPGPARGTLPNQMPVSGYLGQGLVNSFFKGDGSIGKLTSPPFKIERKYLRFLIGGGGFPGETSLNLRVNGELVRTAAGPNTRPGGSEKLDWQFWDVSDLAGQEAVLEIVDFATGGWGHINVDHIVQSDRPPPKILTNPQREFNIAHRYLNLPIKNGAEKKWVSLIVDGKVERDFNLELADGEPDWYAFLDLTPFKGQPAIVRIDRLAEDSAVWNNIQQSDTILGAENLYREPLRPQFHFSPRRGWNNDPNGLVYYQGEYHLFFQHNPYGWNWGNMHWGHAVSRDLVHWQELPEALYPDALGTMFSGSAVVDWRNSAGFAKGGDKAIVLFYTAAGGDNRLSKGMPFTQCVAYSTNRGRAWIKHNGNPVLRNITSGNRDPKVLWHEPSRQWIMTLYVEVNQVHTIQFFASTNLLDWKYLSRNDGYFECPDFFELPVDGNPSQKKWVLTAANSDYAVGTFDGVKFTPETAKLKGHRGQGFYAAQTYSDIPPRDGRRIQIGWLQAPTPGMPFNQAMSLPLELRLVSTADGPRLTWTPVRELEKLRGRAHRPALSLLEEGDPNPLGGILAELVELRAEFTPGDAKEVVFEVRGAKISYDAPKQELVVNGHRAPAPLRDGRQRLTLYCDRNALEIFASDGLTYVPMPFLPAADNRRLSLQTKGGRARFSSLSVYELKPAW